MTVYRTQAIIEDDYVSNKKLFKFIEVKNKYISECPLCAVNWYSYNHTKEICHFNNKIVISGFFWWKKLCPLYTVHYHIKCSECKAIFIAHIYEDKIQEVSI